MLWPGRLAVVDARAAALCRGQLLTVRLFSQPSGLIGDNGLVQVAILGPLEVRDDGGEPVVISGARLRDLIARLALAGGRPGSTPALAEAVWGDEPPADLGNALQTLVSRARRALGSPQAVEQ